MYEHQYNEFVCVCPEPFHLDTDGISCVIQEEPIDNTQDNTFEHFGGEKAQAPTIETSSTTKSTTSTVSTTTTTKPTTRIIQLQEIQSTTTASTTTTPTTTTTTTSATSTTSEPIASEPMTESNVVKNLAPGTKKNNINDIVTIQSQGKSENVNEILVNDTDGRTHIDDVIFPVTIEKDKDILETTVATTIEINKDPLDITNIEGSGFIHENDIFNFENDIFNENTETTESIILISQTDIIVTNNKVITTTTSSLENVAEITDQKSIEKQLRNLTLFDVLMDDTLMRDKENALDDANTRNITTIEDAITTISLLTPTTTISISTTEKIRDESNPRYNLSESSENDIAEDNGTNIDNY